MFQRLRFTFFMAILLAVLAAMTGTLFHRLDHGTLAWVGLAAKHLQSLEVHRIFTSVFLTHGWKIFWRSWTAMILILGFCEWRCGTWRTVTVFWTGHIFTVLVLSLLIVPSVYLTHPTIAQRLMVAGDVGPSAGYYACLAWGIGTLHQSYQRLSACLLIFVALLAVLFWQSMQHNVVLSAWLAAVAHLVAFVGTFSWGLSRRMHKGLAVASSSICT